MTDIEEEEKQKAVPPKTRSPPNMTHMPMIIDTDNTNTVMPTIIKNESNHDKFNATTSTIEKKSGTTTSTGAEEDEVCHTIDDATIDNATIDDKFTTSTNPTEEDPPTTITPLKTKTTGDEFPILSHMFDIDNEFTTSNTTDEEDEDEKSNNYYDNINNEIFRTEYEGTTVFDDYADTEPCAKNVTSTTSNNNINTVQQLAEDARQEAKWAAARAQREADRVERS